MSHCYFVTFKWNDRVFFEHTHVYCNTKRQINKILRERYGEKIDIVDIELEY